MSLNPDLIVRPFNEITDDVLVALTGGVVNEPLNFDIREPAYPLSERAAAVRGVTGTFDGAHYNFKPNVDWRFDPAQNAIVWVEKGAKPDPADPRFFVDYFRRDGPPSPITDINVGSVTRTLTEAMSRELAILYQQVNLAYQSGFIDLAKGQALDFVVSILDVQRLTADYATGLVSFSRRPTSQGNITIPQGTLLSTEKGILFETTSERTLQRGQVRIDVPVRAGQNFKGPDGRVDAHAINILAVTIEGIDSVSNYDPTTQGAADESDEELRERAKAKLRSLSQCTIDALRRTAFEARATNVEIFDPMVPADEAGQDNSSKRTSPGTVVMIVEVEPERFPDVASAIAGNRAAGINVLLLARYIYIRPRISVKIRRQLSPDGKEQVKLDVIKALQDFVAGIGSGKPIPGKPPQQNADRPTPSAGAKPAGLLDAILNVPDVNEASILNLLVWKTITEEGAQLGQRQPTSDLVVNASGSPATDEDLQAANFSINIPAQYWPVIEMDSSDIQITGPN